MKEELPDNIKRRLKEFEKVQKTGTSSEFDRGYKKGEENIRKDYIEFLKKIDRLEANDELDMQEIIDKIKELQKGEKTQ